MPDFPTPDRFWAHIDRLGITHAGMSPSFVRAQMARHDVDLSRHDLGTLEVIGSTGEAMTPGVWRWLHREVGRGEIPIINCSGGTEVGCGILAGSPVVPMLECQFAGPAPGMDADVVDEHGESVHAEEGELVVRSGWPSISRGFWRDEDGAFERYFSRWEGIWAHGDRAIRHETGWEILGRSDDILKIAGKRIGPAEFEELAETDPGVVSAAAVAVDDEAKGQAAVVFVAAAGDEDEPATIAARVQATIVRALGRAFAPRATIPVRALPMTRSGKVHRRSIRLAIAGRDQLDLSMIENPDAVWEVVAAWSSHAAAGGA